MKEETTEQKIWKSALEEFASHGLDGARVDRIAERAKINKAMIYYHYKGKEALYEGVLKSVYQRLSSDVFGKIPEETGPEEQIRKTITNIINFMQEVDPNFVRVMLRELGSGGIYFKKLFFPEVAMPGLALMNGVFEKGIAQGAFKKIHPVYTFIQTIGSIIFFNSLRITMADTEEGKLLFPDDCFTTFRENLLLVLTQGIRGQGEEK